MRKILKQSLLTIFALATSNLIWLNLFFATIPGDLIKVAFILALFELIIKPLVKILLLPINILTLGTIRIVINTLGLYLAVFLLDTFRVNPILIQSHSWQGFNIPTLSFTGFWTFLISSITINLIVSFYKLILFKKTK